MLAMERANKERNRLITHMCNTRPFRKTHSLILAMEGADKERNGLILVTYTTQDHSVKLTF